MTYQRRIDFLVLYFCFSKVHFIFYSIFKRFCIRGNFSFRFFIISGIFWTLVLTVRAEASIITNIKNLNVRFFFIFVLGKN
jgi:hypothetical protein